MATYYVDNAVGNDANAGTSPGSGNAWATINKAATTLVAGDTAHIKATGTNYSLTTTQAFTNSGSTAGGILYRGYTTTPDADDGRPVITSATSALNLFNIGNKTGLKFQHLKFTHTGSTRGSAIVAQTTASAIKIAVVDCVFDGALNAVNGDWGANFLIEELIVHRCQILNCTGDGIFNAGTSDISWTLVKACTGDGIKGNALSPEFSISDTVVTGCNRGIHLGQTGTLAIRRCAIHGNSSHGIIKDHSSIAAMGLIDSIIYGNGGYGVTVAAGSLLQHFNRNNAYGANTSGARNVWPAGTNDVTLTADPFVNASSSDFALNSTAGGGAACRNAGYGGMWFGTNYGDIGAVRHQDPAGGGGTTYSRGRVVNV